MGSRAERKQELIRRVALASIIFLVAPMTLPFYHSPQEALRLTAIAGLFLAIVIYFASGKFVRKILSRESEKAKSIIQNSNVDPLRFTHAVYHQKILIGRSLLFPLQLGFGVIVIGLIGYYRELPWPLILVAAGLMLFAIVGVPRKYSIDNGQLQMLGLSGQSCETVDLKAALAWKEFYLGSKVLMDADGKIIFELPGVTFSSKILNDYVENYLIKVS